MLTQNSKLKKDGIWSFGITTQKTCPAAAACKQYCYACKGNYARFKSVAESKDRNFESTKSPLFVEYMVTEISKKKKVTAIRIHDSGDFYNQEYLDKWIKIAELLPNVVFYAYTKSVHLNFNNRPKNFLIIGSVGGKFDHVLEALFQHKKIDSIAVIHQKGDTMLYADAHESDLVAIEAAKKGEKISLVFH